MYTCMHIQRFEILRFKSKNEFIWLWSTDPLFTGDVLKFKNHVFEEARRRNMPEPEFTEECEPDGN